MSGTGKCFDNARMESFFATLKKELIHKVKTETLRMETVKGPREIPRMTGPTLS